MAELPSEEETVMMDSGGHEQSETTCADPGAVDTESMVTETIMITDGGHMFVETQVDFSETEEMIYVTEIKPVDTKSETVAANTEATVANTEVIVADTNALAADTKAVAADAEEITVETEILATEPDGIPTESEALASETAVLDVQTDMPAAEISDQSKADPETAEPETEPGTAGPEPGTSETEPVLTTETDTMASETEIMTAAETDFVPSEAGAGVMVLDVEPQPPQEGEPLATQDAGQDGEVLLLTLLETTAEDGTVDVNADGNGDGSELVTLHGGAPAGDGPAKIETRLAVREALLPSRRSSRPKARPPRCRACGGPPGRGRGAYCADCTEAAGSVGTSDDDDRPPVPPCADCGRVFDTPVSLVSHRNNEHAGVLFSCAFCSKAFLRRADLKNHMNLHLGIKKSVCDICGRHFSHMSNLYRHRRTHTGERPYVCSICGKRFSQANALNAHAETHERKTSHMCPFCPKKFRNRSQLAGHIRLMHQDEVQPSRRQLVARQFHCGVCGARLDSQAKLRRHLQSHPADSLFCTACEETFKTADELTKHACRASGRNATVEEEEEDVVGASDGEEVETMEEGDEEPTRTHLQRASYMLSDSGVRKEEESANLLAAAEQNTEVDHLMDEMVAVQSVGTQYDVSEILYLTETERLGSPPPPPSPPPPLAEEEAQTEEEVEETEQAKGKEEDAEEEGDVEVHIEKVIESVARGKPASPSGQHAEQFPCGTCGRMFSRLSNLRQHEAMHDATLQRFRCDHCDMTFAWQQTRDRHVLKKHSGAVKRVECPICEKMYLPDSLRGHIKRIHEGIREYDCDICTKMFHTRAELLSHLRTHTNERPYVCSTCGRQFGHLCHLRRHEEVHMRMRAAEDRPGRTYQKIAPRPHLSQLQSGPGTGTGTGTVRPRLAAQDIVRHSLESARIPLGIDNAFQLPPGARLVAAAPVMGADGTTHFVPVMPMAAEQRAPTPPPEDVVTVGPECKEIIIVECEV